MRHARILRGPGSHENIKPNLKAALGMVHRKAAFHAGVTGSDVVSTAETVGKAQVSSHAGY